MQLTINNKPITTPASWNDMTLHQQLTCYGTLFAAKSEILAEEAQLPAKRLSLAMYLADIDEEFMNLWEADCISNYGLEEGRDIFCSEAAVLCEITDFLFDIEEVESEEDGSPIQIFQVKLALTKNPYPVLMTRDRKKKLIGPANECENLSIYELGIAFTYFEAYMNTHDIKTADTLLAILWRPEKKKTKKNKRRGYEGDRRLPYLKHESTVERRIPIMAALPDHVKQLMLFWFASCRQHIINEHPDIFKAPEGSEGESADYGALLLEIAGGVVHLDQVAKQSYSNVFAFLSKLERERIQRAMQRRS